MLWAQGRCASQGLCLNQISFFCCVSHFSADVPLSSESGMGKSRSTHVVVALFPLAVLLHIS